MGYLGTKKEYLYEITTQYGCEDQLVGYA